MEQSRTKAAIDGMIAALDGLPEHVIHGEVTGAVGLLIEVEGLPKDVCVGDHLRLSGRDGSRREAEVVGFRNGRVLAMPFGAMTGLACGARAEMGRGADVLYPDHAWLGRVIDAFGRPLDGQGPLVMGRRPCPVRADAIPAHQRSRVGAKLDVGVRTLNAFLTCCRGQRLGIFAGSGVGKSTLLSMMARQTEAEINVIGLIGERGREAREFIEDALGEEGLRRSVVVVATSDQAPLLRRRAAQVTLAVAEFFRDSGADVLLMVDSVTRFAMAEREIGLAVGEPPTTKGYTPSVFAELPRLLERAGPGVQGGGSITAMFTVLVDGDDHDEPIADAVRGILDGHVVLDRKVAEQGRYPPINVLRSVSRSMPGCNTAEENKLVARARRAMATYDEMADLIRLGAYRAGTDPAIDEAIRLRPALEEFLAQGKDEPGPLRDVYGTLARILNGADAGGRGA
ncbi:MAG: flagellar protein export ATPase FliI [Rhodospirillales bacterium]